MNLTGERRSEVARILETVAKDGLPGPRDLDVALDAIEAALKAPDDEDEEWQFCESSPGVMRTTEFWKRDNEATWMRLMSVDADVSEETVATWSDEQVKLADVWALSCAYSASDNTEVIVPPRPDFIPHRI